MNGVSERRGDLGRDLQHLGQLDRVIPGVCDPVGNVVAAGVLGDEVRPAIAVFAAVVEGDRVGVSAHARDRIELAPHAPLAEVVEGLGLDQREPYLATGMTVGREINPLVAAPADQPLELIPTGADVRQIAQCCWSAEDGEHAATARELEALAPRGLAKACEQDLARGIQQRPAIVGGAQPEAVGRTVGEPEAGMQLDCGSSLRYRGHSKDCGSEP